MKPLIKIIKYLSLCLCCALLIIACTGNTGQENAQTTGEDNQSRIVIGTTLKPRTLDPADSYELAGLNIIYNVGESLYTYQLGTTELKPLLATEMPKISDDGLVYTIPLRQGVTFHDGTPFNAEAMKFSLERFIANDGKPSFLLADTVESMEATQEYELTITLSKPFAAFPALLAFPGTCAVSPQAYTIGQGEFKPNEIVATGPYTLNNFSSDSLSLNVFEDYWGQKPENEGVDIQIYTGNSANLFNSFRTNTIDVAYQTFAPEQITSLLEESSAGKWQDIAGNGTVVSYMVLNRNQKPLDQIEVRQAIAALMNRNLIIERVLQGQAEPVYSLIPNVFQVYEPVFQEYYGDADVSKAKELLTQAGFSADNPAVVEIWYPSASNTRASVAATLQAFAQQELGGMIQFEPNAVESATAFSNLGKGIYASFLADWYPDFLDPDNYIQPFLDCTQGSKAEGCIEGGAQTQGSFFYDQTLNELIDRARKESDLDARQTIFAEIQKILAEEVPYIPLWQTKDYAFAQNGITGVIINPSQNFPFWTIKRENQ